MHYRTSVDALEQRHAELGSEIARVEKEIAELGGTQLALRRVRAELAAKIEEQQPPSPILDRVRIASPCGADWEKMTGDDRVRFCGDCKKHVYNITNMSRREAEALLTENASACVRFYQRADGTILTEDCSVGVQKKQRRKLALAVIGGTAMWGAGVAAAASLVAGVVKQRMDEQEQLQSLQAEEQVLPPLRTPPVAPPFPHTAWEIPPPRPGQLFIDGMHGARVRIDNEIAVALPSALVSLKPGYHSVTIEIGGRSETQGVWIRSDETSTITQRIGRPPPKHTGRWLGGKPSIDPTDKLF